MSDKIELWELPDDMSPADRLSVESILHHAGGKKIVMQKTTIADLMLSWLVPETTVWVEVSDDSSM